MFGERDSFLYGGGGGKGLPPDWCKNKHEELNERVGRRKRGQTRHSEFSRLSDSNSSAVDSDHPIN